MKNNPSAFSETSLGSGLALSVSDSILQTKIRVDEHRMARSQYGIGTGSGHIEFYIYSPNALAASAVLDSTSSGHRVCVGIVDGQASFSKYVGQDTHGWGIEPDGYVWHNGAIVARFTAWTLNDYIGITLDQVRQALTFTKNGTVLGSVDLPSESAGAIIYYYAATVSGNPGDLAVWANAGQTPQRYPGSTVGGWFHLGTGLVPLYLATEPYICASDDETPNQKYEGDLDRAQSPPNINRGVKFWPWGSSAPSQLQRGGQIQLTILDPHGDYDELTSLDIRDQLVTISTVYQGEPLSNATPVLEAVIDRCEQPTDQTKLLFCTDKLALLQSQLVRPLFAPNADPAVAGKPWPLSIGICRTYVPPFYDTANLKMAAGDEFITAVGKWRHGGREWGYTIDYSVDVDGKTFIATEAQTAKVTAETTTFGGTFSESDVDILTNSSGTGVFGSAVANAHGQPDGWLGTGGYFRDDPINTVFQLVGSSPNKVLRQAQSADTVYRLKRIGSSIAPGETCAYEVVVKLAPFYGSGTDEFGNPIDIPPAYLGFGCVDTNSFQFYLWKKFPVADPQFYHGGPAPSPVTYRGTFTNNQNLALPLIFGFLCNNLIQGSGGITSLLEVESIRVVSLPALLQNVTLDGPGLDGMLQDIFITHGPLRADEYDPTGAVAIDADTGYKCGIHVSENETQQCMDVARPVLDSFCADAYVNRAGKVSTVRLIAPEDVDDADIAGTLTANDFQGYLQPFPDNAENLRTRLSGCKNYDPYSESDFANVSLDDVPQIVRKQLEQQFQWTVTANAVLSPKYAAYATTAAPLPSQLDREVDGQTEISRVCNLYTSPRHFYVCTVFAKDGRTFELGDVWDVTYPFRDFEDSSDLVSELSGAVAPTTRRLFLAGIQEQPSEGISTLTLWGL
jgi:hypothetical protein